MDIVAYLRVLRRHWKIIVAATAIGAVTVIVSAIVSVVTRAFGAAPFLNQSRNRQLLPTVLIRSSPFRC